MIDRRSAFSVQRSALGESTRHADAKNGLRSRRAPGFTLIELLVASLCFSILLLGYTALFKYSLDAWMRAISRSAATDNVHSATAAMFPVIRSAMPPFNQNTDVKMIAFDAAQALGFTQAGRVGDYLQFHTITYTASENEAMGGSDPNNGSDLVKFGFWLARSGTTDTRIMLGFECGGISDYIPSIPAGLTAPEEFAYRIADFDMKFTANGTTWVSDWMTSASVSLPKMLRVTIVQKSRTNSQTTQLLLRPRVTTRDITL